MAFISIQNKKVHYQTWGRGEPFLFVHGWGGSIQSLTPLAKLFANTNKSFLVDLPGFGESQNPDPDWGIKEYTDVIAKLISGLHLKKVVYFGHSFGGTIGICLAANYPGLLNKLILCDASYKRNTDKQKIPSFIRIFFDYVPFLKKIIYKIFFPNSDLLLYPQLESNFKKIVADDMTTILKKIKTVTLILWAENDTDTPVANAYELQKKIKHSTLKIFPDSTHNLPLKNPELLVPVIKKIL
jgi:pimeloyl-ACP methyl ester carboxylesterase